LTTISSKLYASPNLIVEYYTLYWL